jgi:drug/metabolite transporter (DMT)-like permease
MSKKWLLLISLSIIWGSSFILIKKGLLGLSPLQLGALRIIFAGLFIIPIGLNSVLKMPKLYWKHIVITALLGTFLPAFLFAIAQTQINSSISAVLNSLTPLNTLWVGYVWFGMQFNKNQFIGVIIGFIGSLILVLNAAQIQPTHNYWYAVFIIIASTCYALNVNYLKKNLYSTYDYCCQFYCNDYPCHNNLVLFRLFFGYFSRFSISINYFYFNFRGNWNCNS